MPKRIRREILLEVIGRFPQGASLEEILLGLDPTTTRRTLQRWLSQLVESKEVAAIGQARARRYKLFYFPEKESVSTRKQAPFPVSEAGLWIQQKVSQPLHARHPCTYNKEFLERYKPNDTYYLSEASRISMLAMGTEDGKYPAGTYARQIFQRLLIDLSWNSSRLEGNTYSLIETERLIRLGNPAVGKDLKETQMILNHKAAIEFLIDSAEEIGINRFTILNLHTLLSDNLLSDPAACGRIRSISVGISHSTYLPLSIPQVIEECFDLILSKAVKIRDPFEQAFFLMVHIPYLQAFDDVNKRTSRLAANIPLISKNLCPLSFIDVPEHLYINGLLGVYELNRMELLRDVFIWSYERSCIRYATTRNAIGEPDPFRIEYRSAIKHIVGEIVRQGMNKEQAVAAIRNYAMHGIPEQDRSKFIETVERELLTLHAGNIARYQLREKEYDNWKKTWD